MAHKIDGKTLLYHSNAQCDLENRTENIRLFKRIKSAIEIEEFLQR